MNWEYFVVRHRGSLDDDEIKKALDQLGAQGWELVSATSYELRSTKRVSVNSNPIFGDQSISVPVATLEHSLLFKRPTAGVPGKTQVKRIGFSVAEPSSPADK
jgi:Domain of unknown function (DUF4177)